MLLRIAHAAILARSTSAPLALGHLIVVPLQDLLQFAAQFFPYFSKQVDWRGHRARLGPGTRMLPLEVSS